MKLTVAIVLAAFAGQFLSVATAAAEDLAAVLARPVSPGSVALLVEHIMDPAAQKRLIEAVKHEDPAVRAVAARIAFVTMSKGTAPALVTTLAKEEHAQTAAEQVRTLMAFHGAAGDNIIRKAVQRIGGPTAIAMAESLARNRPADIPLHLPFLLTTIAKPDRHELAAALATACVQHPTHAEAIVAAILATKDDDVWGAVLDTSRFLEGPEPSVVTLRGLTAPEESQRVQTLWHVHSRDHVGAPIADDVLAAMAPPPIPAGTPAASLTWEAFVRELFARHRGAPATGADWPGMLQLPAHKEHVTKLDVYHWAYANLSDAELKAIDAVKGDNEAAKMRRFSRDDERKTQKAAKPAAHTVRTLPVFAKGLLADLMAVHGCRRPGTSWFAGGELTYRPDGRAQSLSIVQVALGQDCQAFVRSAMTLAVASVDFPITPESRDVVLVLFTPEFLSCADDPFPASRPRGADLAFEYPKRKIEPRLQYPQEYRRLALPDTEVFLRARVSHTGCIASAETLRSAQPAFDMEAIRALFNAKMTPATLGGQAVDATISYSFRFSLGR
jgi:TonB family protein